MFLISDITTFSKKNSKHNKLLIGGAILGTGLLGVVGVKSYLRNGRLVKSYNRNQLLNKPVVKDTKLLLPASTRPINNDVIVLGNVNNKTNNIKDEFESYINNDKFNYDEFFTKFNFEKLDNIDDFYPVNLIRRKYIKDNNITEDERKSLVSYVRHKYDDVNNYLITGVGTEETQQLTNNLNNLLNRLPTFENKTTFRYIREVDPTDLLPNYKIGGIVTEPRFTSSSTNEFFDSDDFLKHSKVRFKIKSKSNNSNAIDIRGFNPKEEEVIFKPGTNFKINNIKQHEFTYETKSNKNKQWKGYEIEIEEV